MVEPHPQEGVCGDLHSIPIQEKPCLALPLLPVETSAGGSCGLITIDQGSEVPTLGTFSGTLSRKWAKVGKMGENGGK